MGSPNPWFEAPSYDSPYLDLLNQFGRQQEPYYSEFLSQDDPDVIDYQNLAAQPTGSEDLIRDYVDRRPTFEDYDPGLGRKMTSFLLGTLTGGNSGTGYTAAKRHLYAPLEQDMSDWKSEGTGITSRARLLDAERKRELTARKYGLTAKAGTMKAEAAERSRRQRESRYMAEDVSREDERKARVEERAGAREFREDMSTQLRDMQIQRDEDSREARADRNTRIEEDRSRRETERADKEAEFKVNAPIRINKQIKAMAELAGFDVSDMESQGLTTRDMAIMMAKQRASEHPAFKNLFEEGELTEPSWRGDNSDEQRRILKNYIDSMVEKMLDGRFE